MEVSSVMIYMISVNGKLLGSGSLRLLLGEHHYQDTVLVVGSDLVAVDACDIKGTLI